MVNSNTYKMKRLIYIISSLGIIWMGFGLIFCYEMGKHGIDNIDWGFIFLGNLPVVIIAGSLLISAFRAKKQFSE